MEPFTAYVDMTGKGRSRIDYYGGQESGLLRMAGKALRT